MRPEAAVKVTQMTVDIPHAPVPLTELITGTMLMHFPGTSVKRRMTLAEAQSVQQMIDDKRSSDALDWFHLGWVQFSDKIVACEFTADEDCGWGMTSEDRTALKRTHPHGILRTLRDLWRDKGGRQPAFSPLALQALSGAALDGLSAEASPSSPNASRAKPGPRRSARSLTTSMRRTADRHRRRSRSAPAVPTCRSTTPPNPRKPRPTMLRVHRP